MVRIFFQGGTSFFLFVLSTDSISRLSPPFAPEIFKGTWPKFTLQRSLSLPYPLLTGVDFLNPFPLPSRLSKAL